MTYGDQRLNMISRSHLKRCVVVFIVVLNAMALSAHATLAQDVTPRTLVAASSNNFPPINQLDERGELTGFARDLSQAVGKAIGVQIRHLHSPYYKDALNWLESGEADFIHDTTYSKERDSLFDFSDPIIKMSEVIFVAKDNATIAGVQDLNNKLVACVTDHITTRYLQQYSRIQCQMVKTPMEGVFSVLSGKVDAFIYPRDIVWALSQRANVADKIKTVGTQFRELSWSMVVKRGNTQTLSLLNEGLRKVRESGEYTRIHQKWFGGQQHGYSRDDLIFAIIAATLGSGFILLLIFTWKLRRTTRTLRSSLGAAVHAKRALEISEGRFHAVVRSAHDSIITIDSQGFIESTNPATELIFGYSKDEMVGQPISIVMTDADAAFHAQYVSAYLETGKARVIGKAGRQLLGQRKDGSVFPMEISINEFMVEDRHMFAGIIRDITNRVRVEQELRDSETRAAQAEHRLVHALDSISDGFVIYDSDDRLVMCNDKFRQMWGDISDLLVPGTTFEDMAWALAERKLVDIPENEIEDWVGERILAHRRGHGSFSVRLKDGTWMLHHDRRMRDGGYVGIRTNVTELKLREEALIEDKQRLAYAQRIANLGNWEVNLRTNDVMWSDQMYEIFDLPPESTPLDQRNFLYLVDEEDRARVQDAYKQALSEQALYRVTYRINTHLSHQRVIESEGRIECDEDGTPLRMIGITHDITELRQQQTEIEHSHSLLSLISTMQSEFIMEADPHALFQNMLETVLDLTESSYALIGEVVDAEPHQPGNSRSYVVSYSISKDGPPLLIDTAEQLALMTPLFDSAIDSKGPQIVKDAVTLPRGAHPDITLDNALLIPILSGTNEIGILFLANKRSGYDSDVADHLTPLTATCGNILEAYRHGLLRAQAEQALIESEQRYRGLVERSPNPIVVHRNLVILYANKAASILFGFAEPMDMVGRSWLGFIPEEYHNQSRARIKSATGTDVRQPLIYLPMIRKDGTIIDTDAQVSGIIYNGENALESVIHDITDRIKAERALKESEVRYRVLVDQAPDAIIVHSNGGIIFANQAATRLFGTDDVDDLIGLDLLERIHSDSQDAVSNRIISSIEGAPIEGLFEDRMLKLDGTVMECEITATHIIFNGKPSRQVVIRDVTARKLMDAQMVQTAKLATLGEMAASMAHELSQPLNIIRFAAEGALLKISKGKAGAPYQEKQFDTIQNQAVRMAEIMDNVRIFSRSDSGAVELFDPNLSVQAVATMVRSSYKADSIKLSLRGTGLGLLVNGRQIQLEQVILNLVKNAHDAIVEHIKADPETNEGRVEVSCLHVESTDHINIVITDTGGGIEQDEIERIFDPFFTTKDVGAGTGLGLSVSYGIIANMGGTLSADNIKNGARFTISLPVAGRSEGIVESVSPLSIPVPVSSVMADSCHILVVDDEVEAANAMAGFLEDEGFRISIAHNGEEGLEVFAADPADLVITDLRMPRLDGYGMIERLRAESPDLPIIVITGHVGITESPELNDGLDVKQILRKPVSLGELAQAVDLHRKKT